MKPNPAAILLADQWQDNDYALLETGDGMKRERWGSVVLVRPDPQILWPLRAPDWGDFDGFYHRSDKGGGRWEFRRRLPEFWTVRYRELVFKIRPTNFKHTGLFPEQAANWDWFGGKIRAASRPVNILNLFGYTGGATVAAAAAGASVCHVDAAKGMVQWCRENLQLSGLEGAPVRTIVDDCMKFVERETRRGTRYDAVIMDPPSYGRGKTGEVWKLEDDLWKLLTAVERVLADRPLFFLVNTYTTGLSPGVLGNLLGELLGSRGGRLHCGEVGLPESGGRHVLPCGIFGRWES